MKYETIKLLLKNKFTDANVDIAVEGSHLNLRIITDFFNGLNTLKRQQEVYDVLCTHIASGEIHAVTMKTLTLAEAAALEKAPPPKGIASVNMNQ